MILDNMRIIGKRSRANEKHNKMKSRAPISSVWCQTDTEPIRSVSVSVSVFTEISVSVFIDY